MTKEHLRLLAMLPKVIEAVNAFQAEREQLLAALAKAGMVGPTWQAQGKPGPVAGGTPAPVQMGAHVGPIMLQTPERAEYEAALKAGTAFQAPEEESALKRERKEWLRQRKASGDTASKMAQFERSSSPVEDVVVSSTKLALSGSDE